MKIGLSQVEIAQLMNITRGTVHRDIEAMQLGRPKSKSQQIKELYNQNPEMPRSEIAAIVGVELRYVNVILPKDDAFLATKEASLKQFEKDIDLMLSLLQGDFSNKSIESVAQKMDLPESTIRGRIESLRKKSDPRVSKSSRLPKREYSVIDNKIRHLTIHHIPNSEIIEMYAKRCNVNRNSARLHVKKVQNDFNEKIRYLTQNGILQLLALVRSNNYNSKYVYLLTYIYEFKHMYMDAIALLDTYLIKNSLSEEEKEKVKARKRNLRTLNYQERLVKSENHEER